GSALPEESAGRTMSRYRTVPSLIVTGTLVVLTTELATGAAGLQAIASTAPPASMQSVTHANATPATTTRRVSLTDSIKSPPIWIPAEPVLDSPVLTNQTTTHSVAECKPERDAR